MEDSLRACLFNISFSCRVIFYLDIFQFVHLSSISWSSCSTQIEIMDREVLQELVFGAMKDGSLLPSHIHCWNLGSYEKGCYRCSCGLELLLTHIIQVLSSSLGRG